MPLGIMLLIHIPVLVRYHDYTPVYKLDKAHVHISIIISRKEFYDCFIRQSDRNGNIIDTPAA